MSAPRYPAGVTSALVSRAAVLDCVPADVRSLALVGDGVAPLTSAAMRDLGLALSIDRPRWAVVSAEPVPAVDRLPDLPDASLDAIVLRRAWGDRSEAMNLLSIAFRVLRSGGTLVAADLDAEALLDGSATRYPVSVLWRRPEAPSSALRASSLSPAVLSTDVVAARFDSVAISRFDEVLGRHQSMRAFWAAARRHGWRGDAWMTASQRTAFFESLAGGSGSVPVIDREPWLAVTGIRP